MYKFYVGQQLANSSICDSDCIYRAVVIKRTAKTVTILEHGKEKRCKIHTFRQDEETIYPHGRYSMAATFSANPLFNERYLNRCK